MISIHKIKIKSHDVIVKQYSVINSNIRALFNMELDKDDISYFQHSVDYYSMLLNQLVVALKV